MALLILLGKDYMGIIKTHSDWCSLCYTHYEVGCEHEINRYIMGSTINGDVCLFLQERKLNNQFFLCH